MRTTTALATLALGASAASAQLSTSSIISYASSLLSTSCQTAIKSVLSPSSNTGQCLRTDLIIDALNSTGSIIPEVDSYLSSFCYENPCSAESLQNASTTIISGCASDLTLLSSYGITNETVQLFFEVQPLAREVLCLKSTDPYNAANATIPVNSTAYNSTNGTFCATSLLTELDSYLGANLTLTYLETAALGGNSTTLQVLESIPYTALCSDCIFAGVDLIEQEYPTFSNISVGNYTLNTFLDSTCSAQNLTLSNNGTLPANITESAFNSSYPFNVTNGNVTYIATATATSSIPNITSILGNLSTNSAVSSISSSIAAEITSAGNTTALKKRWIGA